MISPIGLAVARHRLEALWLGHHVALHDRIAHALTGMERGAFLERQLLPAVLRHAQGRWSLQLGHSVDVGHAKSELLHALDHLGRRRRSAGLDVDDMIEFAPLLGGRGDQHVENGRRPAHMRDAMLDDHRKDQSGIDLAQADVSAAHRHHRPRETPAVAMEHRQGPQIDGLRRHRPGQDVADRLEKRAAMVIDHALRVAGRARCVVERDRAAFVGWRRPGEPRIALGDEVLVLERSEPLAGPRIQVVDDVDDERALPQLRQCRTDLRGKFPIGDEHLGLTMLQDIGDGCRSRRVLMVFSTAPSIGTP